MTELAYDPVAVEIHRRALDAITNEMAITLTRTSGSPVIYDVQDFATSILDTDGEQLSLSATILFHSGSSLMGTRSIMAATGSEEIRPGDGWIVNDPYSGGAMHQADVAIIMPLFYQGRHVAWAFSNVHVLDIGGTAISGFAPTARSVLEETLRFPPTRIIRDGAIDPGWERYIATNVRIPEMVLNDLRSMIAANNVSQMKLTELIDRMGLERFQEYCRINKELSEQALRARISRLPDGVYETADWVEYDGHGTERLLEMRCRLRITGSDLDFSFVGCPQVDAFINGTPGLVHGSLMATIMTSLAYGDVPFNSGLWRPISVDQAEAGTIVNASPPAPVTGAHAITGTRVTKTVKDVLNQAFALSDDPTLRGRVGGQAWDAAGLSPLAGFGQGGAPTVVFFMDHVGGAGGGAQTSFDGLDLYGMTISPGVGLPSVEINESQQPAMYLWRTLNANSGGPGTYRGGQSMENAWTLHGTDGLAGAITLGCAEVPARGAGGGLPAAAGTWSSYHDTNVRQTMSDGQNAVEAVLRGDQPRRPSNIGSIEFGSYDVLRMSSGGGGGLGDPLLRDPAAVCRDVRDGFITAEHARRAYGVVLADDTADDNVDNTVDEQATAEAREVIRHERLGYRPERGLEQPDTVGISVTHDGAGRWQCGYCSGPLGRDQENWRDHAVSTERPIAEYYATLGMFVRERRDPPRVMTAQRACPSCAGLLAVDVFPEGFTGYRSPRLGAGVQVPALVVDR